MLRIFFLLIPYFLSAQNVDMYLSLLHEGQTAGVKENLPELISKYPNDPGVLYLQALLTTDGMKSLEFYGTIIEKYPESKYAPDASVKIGEYFFARGLYSQAGRQLCQIPRRYPRYSDNQRVVDLMVSSFRAIGEVDSVRYYVGIYQSMFPNLNVEGYGVSSKKKPSNPIQISPKTSEPKPYVVQIGAFGNVGNAKRMQLQISQIGYTVEISPVETNGRKLHAVRVVRFKKKSEAERVGNVIKKKIGSDYRVLYRPKSYKK
ncbi:SPOR domain-containing protein [bacterium]|nr:SPOR domain-containing protein [bacterium]